MYSVGLGIAALCVHIWEEWDGTTGKPGDICWLWDGQILNYRDG